MGSHNHVELIARHDATEQSGANGEDKDFKVNTGHGGNHGRNPGSSGRVVVVYADGTTRVFDEPGSHTLVL